MWATVRLILDNTSQPPQSSIYRSRIRQSSHAQARLKSVSFHQAISFLLVHGKAIQSSSLVPFLPAPTPSHHPVPSKTLVIQTPYLYCPGVQQSVHQCERLFQPLLRHQCTAAPNAEHQYPSANVLHQHPRFLRSPPLRHEWDLRQSPRVRFGFHQPWPDAERLCFPNRSARGWLTMLDGYAVFFRAQGCDGAGFRSPA